MHPAYIDFETRSPVDLKKEGLMRYARHPRTEALMLAWAIGDGPVLLWEPGHPLPEALEKHILAGGIVVAHNAQFELAIWNFVCVKKYGWPRLRIEQCRCTMAAAYAMALPGALEDCAHALGLAVAKDVEGRALMLKMCKPRSFLSDGTPVYFGGPEEFARLGVYCKQDVVVERDIYKRVMPLSDREQRVWVLDQYINLRGMPFDMVSLEAALKLADIEKDRLNEDMARVTGGRVTACSAVAALKEWAADYGVMPDSLAKAELNELLGEESLPDIVEEALLLRQSAGRFTSISKLKAIRQREIGGRVHYAFQYHAATPGRWAGRGVQPHNFTRDLPKPHNVEDILGLIRAKEAAMLRMLYGEPSIFISKCLRGFIHTTGTANCEQLLGGDFKSVEGRGVAWLAGEEWKLEAYRAIDADPSLPDMYMRTYAAAFGIPPEQVTKEQRQEGKVMDLAFGYQGGVGAYRTMGKTYGIRVVATEEAAAKYRKRGEKVILEAHADRNKVAWRESNPRIKAYWYDLEKAAIGAVLDPGLITRAGAAGREVSFRKRGSFLWCRLPSGRTLCYPYPEIRDGQLTFKGVPEEIKWAAFQNWKADYARYEAGEGPYPGENPTYIVDDPTNTRSWCRMSTYGGKLAENVTQAICRDILAEAMLRIEQAGFKVVMHVHDEIIVEGFLSEDDLKRFEELMVVVPPWAAGFPIAADCWLSPRYIKDD